MGTDALNRAKDLLRQSAAIRGELEKRLNDLNAEIKEVRDALASLPVAHVIASTHPRGSARRSGKRKTIPEIVLELVRAVPDGLGAAQIIAGVQEVRKTEAVNIYSVIYRMSRKTGLLIADGEKGERRYRAA